MSRVVAFARSSVVRTGLIAGLVVSAVIAFAAPAGAGVATVTGTATCSNTNHLVVWTLTNGPGGGAMVVGTASEQIGADSFAATGFSASVAASGTTSATSVVPQFATNVTGPLLLIVNVSWPDDNFSTLVYGSVDLGTACPGPTTTTVSQPTTTITTVTTVAHSPTPATTATTTTSPTTKKSRTHTAKGSQRAVPTRTARIIASTAITSTPVTQTVLQAQGQADPTSTTLAGAFSSTLAFTGSGTTFMIIFGLCFITVGGAVLMHKRNALAALRGHETNEELRRQSERKKRSLWVYLPPR